MLRWGALRSSLRRNIKGLAVDTGLRCPADIPVEVWGRQRDVAGRQRGPDDKP